MTHVVAGGVNCPLCAGQSARRFAKEGFWIRDCEICRHRFAENAVADDHVARHYGDHYFQEGGAGYAGYLSEGRIIVDRGRWYAHLLGRYMQPGTVLDVGSAGGFFLKGLVDGGWAGRGVEPNAAMAEHARTRLGLAIESGTLEQLRSSERFDLVTMIQVVAHFTDVRRALQVAAGLLRPNGCLLAETWNRESWTARCLGRHWHEYSPPTVLHWFSPEGLGRLGEEFGLHEVAHGRPKKRISGGHARSLLRHKYGNSAVGDLVLRTLSVVPETFSIPYPADDLFWILLRKSETTGDASSGSGAGKARRG